MMKNIKKLFFVVAIMLSIASFAPILSNVMNITKAAFLAQYVQVVDFDDTANIGGRYYIAEGKSVEYDGVDYEYASDVTVEVKDPLNQTVTIQDDNGADYVDVTMRGKYSVIYSAPTFSQVLYFTAVEGIYAFEFEENSSYIIPSVMNVNATKSVTLPNPSVVDENGEEIENAIVEVKVLKPNTNTPLESPDITLVEGHYVFAVDTIGVWTIEYLYKSADSRVLASTTKTITANNTYNNTYNLTYVYDSSVPTTAITGVEQELPSITAKNPSGNEVEVYYIIHASKVVYNSQTGAIESNTDVTSSVIDGTKFTPNADGDYLITYVVKDFFDNTAASTTFSINDVKDTQAPTVKIVNPYTETPTDEDASFRIPAKVATSNFVLPAIWAEDNVSLSLDKLTLTRKIVRTNGDVIYEASTTPNKDLVFNYNSASYSLDTNTQEAVVLADNVTFSSGTYTITYIAKDEAGNESTSLTYRVVLETNFVDDEDPTIEWTETEAMPINARIGDTISFASPTVEDNVDTRIKTKVEYFFYTSTEPTAQDWQELVAEDGIYEIEVVSAQELRIRATAYDSHENLNTITHVVDIIDTNDQEEITIADYAFNDFGNYEQGQEITLGTVTFEDDYIDFVSFDIFVSVQLANDDIISLDPYDAQTQIIEGSVRDQLEITNAKIFASFAGDYTVVYVAKDLKNNYVMREFDFTVAPYDEQVDIEFTKLPTALNGGTLELGSKITLPQAEFSAPQGATTSYTVRVVNGPTGATINRYEFKPTKVGTYTIEYYGTVIVGAETTNPVKSYTVEVVDTTIPVIGEVYVEPVVAIDYVLTIPQFTASDLSEIDEENSKVVLTSKSFGSRTIYYGDTNSNRVVTLTNNEIYTLTFTVKDIYGNTATLTKTIKVGDTDAPVVTIEDADDFVPTSMNVGDKLTLDISKITVTDLVDTSLSTADLQITLTKDNEEVDNIYGDSTTSYQYEMLTAGTYTLTITVEDAAGNTAETITRTIVVSEDANDGADSTEVIGIVLLVVAVLILAGAIVYFIISKKKADRYKA